MFLNNKSIINYNGRIDSRSIKRGEEDFAYINFNSNRFNFLKSRINDKLAANIAFKSYPLTNVRPMLSFTFDDISESAAIYGAEILEAENARGTFYITTGTMGEHLAGSVRANAKDLQSLHAKGHEIGLHTHAHLPILAYNRFELLADIAKNKQVLNEIIPNSQFENFCYPYGVTSLLGKTYLKNLVRSARSINAQVNKGKIDPHYLCSYIIDSDCIDSDMLREVFDEANISNSWLILTSHQISRRRERLSTTPEMLKLALKLAKELGFDIVTIDQGLNKLNISKLKGKSHV